MKVSQCRLCNSTDLAEVINLGHHPCADTFLFKEQQQDMEPTYPLGVCLCRDCGHAMTTFLVPPQERYQKYDYSYDSSNSVVSIAHFSEMAQQVSSRLKLSASDLVVDVGSNVGTLLTEFRKQSGANVIGIEPASNIALLAENNGIPTINEFFSQKAAVELLKHGRPRVVTATNVFNHTEDLAAFLKTVDSMLAPKGQFVFEVPYLLDLVQKTAFDTIYLEHVNYFGVKPLAGFLNAHGYSIAYVEKQEYMCGSLRVYTERGRSNSKEINAFIDAEEEAKIYDEETYRQFMNRVKKLKLKLCQEIYEARNKGGRIIGIGAATKGNTLLNYCHIDSDTLEYITDTSPLKIGKLTPGSHIPIRSDKDIGKEITHALILPWNIADFLTKKLAHLKLKFLIPQLEASND